LQRDVGVEPAHGRERVRRSARRLDDAANGVGQRGGRRGEALERAQVPPPKRTDRVVVRLRIAGEVHEGHVLPTPALDLARAVYGQRGVAATLVRKMKTVNLTAIDLEREMSQVWLHLLGRTYTEIGFRTPGPYRYVRHPLYVGWLLVFWSAPVMTSAHLVFALATTAYILIAIQFEERDLVQSHKEYAEYRQQVPMLIPIGSSKRAIPVVHHSTLD